MKDYLTLLYIFLNVFVFFAMALDKFFSTKNKRRIPEKFLIFFSIIGGTIGAITSMVFFKHKISKPLFRILIPTALLIHWAAIIYYFFLS